MEIQANEDIIKTMIRSGILDVPLPPEIELQITVDKSKTGKQMGSKSPRMRSQAGTEEANKKTEEGGGRQGRKAAKQSKSGEIPEDRNDTVKNRSNRQREIETEQVEHETEGEKVKNRHRQVKVDTMDLFKLPDFDDDDNDDDYELPVRRRKRGKAVPLLFDDEDEEVEDKADDDNEEEDENNGDDDDEEWEEDYEIDNEEDDDEEQDDDEEEDDEDITLQRGEVEERKQKRYTAAAKGKDIDVVVEERRTVGQHCANVDQATEFRKFIQDLMKTFKEHVRKGKQVKKYLTEMIQDVREACMNIFYPGMDFNLEEIVPTISDPSYKAWRAMLSGVEFVDRNDMKEANTKRNANIVTSDRSNKDAGQIARSTLDSLPTAQRNDCKQILRCLIKHNMEAH